jgi:hypothetical protein
MYPGCHTPDTRFRFQGPPPRRGRSCGRLPRGRPSCTAYGYPVGLVQNSHRDCTFKGGDIPARSLSLKCPFKVTRLRFVQHRLAGLYDELRPGRPRTIEDEQIAALLKRTLPFGGVRLLARSATTGTTACTKYRASPPPARTGLSGKWPAPVVSANRLCTG